MYKQKVNDLLSLDQRSLADKHDHYKGGDNGSNEAQRALSFILSSEWEEHAMNGSGVDKDNL